MLTISTSGEFIFVHIPKTAGSALTSRIEPVAVPRNPTSWRRLLRKLPLREAPDRAHFRAHDTARFVRARVGRDVWQSYTSFAVVRDPFDHAVSHYEFMKQFPSPKVAAEIAGMSFASYLRDRLKKPRPGRRIFARMPDQAHYVCDADGRVIVDHILHFETLDADFRALAPKLGLSDAPLDRVNPTKARDLARDLASWYDDPDAAELVRRIYTRDFDLFGYSPKPAWLA